MVKAVEIAKDPSNASDPKKTLKRAIAHGGWVKRLDDLHWQRFGVSGIDLLLEEFEHRLRVENRFDEFMLQMEESFREIPDKPE